jgi:peptidoglycan/LPS O-acetylase OafA/YrhL
MTVVRRFPKVTFALGALAISSASRWVVASSSSEAHPDSLSDAVLADLVVTMPVLYYLVVVRGRSVPWVTVLPVMMIGLLRARMILPGKQLHHIPGAALLAGAAEFAVLLSAPSMPAAYPPRVCISR